MSMERLARLVLLPELQLVKSVKLSNRILGLLYKKIRLTKSVPSVPAPRNQSTIIVLFASKMNPFVAS